MLSNSPLVIACVWVSRIAWVNICWLSLTLLGFVIGGFFPATVAALVVIRRYLNGAVKVSWPDFYREWKREFIRANLAGWPLLLVAFATAWYFFWLIDSTNETLRILSLALLPIHLLSLIWLTATLLHAGFYQCSSHDSIRNGWGLLSSHPGSPVLMFIVGVVCLVLSLVMPVLSLFMLVSPALLVGVCHYLRRHPEFSLAESTSL